MNRTVHARAFAHLASDGNLGLQYGRRLSRSGFGNSQVTDLICARICARDAAGRVETGETPTPDMDPHTERFAEASTPSGDRARRQRRTSYGS
jgi:hypothetical protein